MDQSPGEQPQGCHHPPASVADGGCEDDVAVEDEEVQRRHEQVAGKPFSQVLSQGLHGHGLDLGIRVQFRGMGIVAGPDVELPPAGPVGPAHLGAEGLGLLIRGVFIGENAALCGGGLQAEPLPFGRALFKGGGEAEKAVRAQMQALCGHVLQPAFHGGDIVLGTGRDAVAIHCHGGHSFPSASAMQARSRSSSVR